MSSTGHAQAEAFNASVSTADLSDPVDYLAARVEELTGNIDTAEKVAAGAKATATSLRAELKQVTAELKAARAGREG